MHQSGLIAAPAPVWVGDTVEVTVAGLAPQRRRARLSCTCRVGEAVVLDGEALVKVPSAAKAKWPPRRV